MHAPCPAAAEGAEELVDGVGLRDTGPDPGPAAGEVLRAKAFLHDPWAPGAHGFGGRAGGAGGGRGSNLWCSKWLEKNYWLERRLLAHPSPLSTLAKYSQQMEVDGGEGGWWVRAGSLVAGGLEPGGAECPWTSERPCSAIAFATEGFSATGPRFAKALALRVRKTQIYSPRNWAGHMLLRRFAQVLGSVGSVQKYVFRNILLEHIFSNLNII